MRGSEYQGQVTSNAKRHQPELRYFQLRLELSFILRL
jgi:hypothetical protein